jgi:hypothetical protein
MSSKIQATVIQFVLIHIGHATFMVRSDGAIYVGSEENWSKVSDYNITTQARDLLLNTAKQAMDDL